MAGGIVLLFVPLARRQAEILESARLPRSTFTPRACFSCSRSPRSHSRPQIWQALASLRECHALWGRESFDRAEAEAGYASMLFSPPAMVVGLLVVGTGLLAYCLVCGLLYGF